MKPEASFDILYLLDRLKVGYSDIHSMELYSLIYLSYLLSIYDGKPSEKWHYQFAQHKLGGPYAEDLAETLETLISSGFVRNKEGKLSVSEASAVLLNATRTLTSLGWREKYLAAASDAVMSRTLPMAINAIQKEPMLSQSSANSWRSLLGVDHTLDSLYEEIVALRDVLGVRANDIWLASLNWLDYWKASGEQEVEMSGN